MTSQLQRRLPTVENYLILPAELTCKVPLAKGVEVLQSSYPIVTPPVNFHDKAKISHTAPQWTYVTGQVYTLLREKVSQLIAPFDHTFELTDNGAILVTVRVMCSGVSTYRSWSVNGQQFVYNDCYGRELQILKQLDAALNGLQIC